MRASCALECRPASESLPVEACSTPTCDNQTVYRYGKISPFPHGDSLLKAGPMAGYTAEPPGGSEKTSTPRFLGPVSEFLGWRWP